MSGLAHILLRRLVPSVGRHLSSEQLADFACEEMSSAGMWIARRHVNVCGECRQRLEYLEGTRAEQVFDCYRRMIDETELQLSRRPRAELAAWLESQTFATEEQPPRLFDLSLSRVQRFVVPASIAAGLLIAVAAVGWNPGPKITPNALLLRAESWERPGRPDADVVQQTVLIKAGKKQVTRSIYRDLRGKRRPVLTQTVDSNRELRVALSDAGIDWNEPISATSYQKWHDQQRLRTDRITQGGDHLLTLTTSVPAGAVLQESITVRDSDFHALARTVDFRERGRIEIAELDFHLLPWSSVTPNLFEPLETRARATDALPSLKLPSSVSKQASEDQLDATELTARLILNRLHADTGEQIAVMREPQRVEISGLVETDARKRELREQLMTVPRLKVEIESVTDVAKQPVPGETKVSVTSTALPDHPSSLQAYLAGRGRSVESINVVAQKLFNSAMTVSLESRELLDLEHRFRGTKELPVMASASLAELLYSHHERLQDALRQERQLLKEAAGGAAESRINDATSLPEGEAVLADAASRNLMLMRELTQTNAPAERDATTIFREISETADWLGTAARQTYMRRADDAALTTKSHSLANAKSGERR